MERVRGEDGECNDPVLDAGSLPIHPDGSQRGDLLMGRSSFPRRFGPDVFFDPSLYFVEGKTFRYSRLTLILDAKTTVRLGYQTMVEQLYRAAKAGFAVAPNNHHKAALPVSRPFILNSSFYW